MPIIRSPGKRNPGTAIGERIMYQLTYRITTLSPVVLSAHGGETHIVPTREFIPSSTLIGMLAARYIEKYYLYGNAHKNDTFFNWFLKSGLSFGNAYIESIDKRGDYYKNEPIPFSIQQEKGNPTDAFDLLLHQNQHQTSMIGGYGKIESNFLLKQKVKKSLNYHHQHDPDTGIVEEGIFFNYEAIETGQTFSGELRGEKEMLLEFKKEFNHHQSFHIGRSRNTQYGKIKFELISDVTACNLNVQDLEIKNGEVTLTFISPVLIYNKNGLSTTDDQYLLKSLNIGDYVKIKKAFVKTDDIENYVSLWKLRTQSEICFKAGSCFLLAGVRETDKEKLAAIMRSGIGERRREGFGRVVFNLQKIAKLKVDERKEADVYLERDVPQETKEILTTIVNDAIFQLAKSQAIQESLPFKGLRSKSILSRLLGINKNLKAKGEKFEPAKIQELRDTAKYNLEKCDNGDKTLTEFITQKTLSVEEILSKKNEFTNNLNQLLEDENLEKNFKTNLLTDEEFNNELYYIYFDTFFTAMRKRMQARPEEE
jgi:CRISPR-associated protein Csx10